MSRPEPSRVPTLQDLEVATRALGWPQRKIQEAVSALRTIARGIGRPPGSIPADARTLAAMIARGSPHAVGISPRRWSNVRSSLGSVLEATTGSLMRGRSSFPMSAQWTARFDRISARRDQYRLSPLLRWLSEEGVEPADVRLPDLDRYRSNLHDHSLQLNPKLKWQQAVRAWNRCVNSINDWPKIELPKPVNRAQYTVPWSALPESLRADIDAWVARVSGKDFADDGPNVPLSAATLRGRLHLIHGYVSALVHQGVSLTSLRTLSDCLTLENYKLGLKFFEGRVGRNATLHQRAFELRSIARHWCHAKTADLEAMGGIVRRLAPIERGMRPKNRDRLRPLQNDPAMVHRLLSLPFMLQREVQQGRVPDWRKSVQAQLAVAIEILLFTGLRLKNLTSIEIDRHLFRRPGGWFLSFPPAEVKNRRELHFELAEESAGLLDWYIAKYLPDTTGPRYLFPGEADGPKSDSAMRQQIAGAARKYTGLVVNPHLFRHIDALLFLLERPGEYETMRLVLAHNSTAMLTNHYAGLEVLSATKHFDRVIRELRRVEELPDEQ